MPEPKLKPCPFCGVEPNVRQIPGGGFFFVECVKPKSEDCPAFAYTGATDRDEAIRRWNTRKGERDA